MAVAHQPDDLPEFSLTELERYLADQASVHPGAPAFALDDRVDDQAEEAGGQTRRVRRLAHEVAEARQLVALQDTPALVTAHSTRVLRTIRRSAEAEKLVKLRQQPAFIALATVRARRIVTTTGLISLAIALGWSTAGVQSFAAGGAPRFSPQWWFAWGVEPFVSLALLTVVIARALLASRGQSIDATVARRVERVFLGATLVMNTWRHLPWVAHPFRVDQLVVHMLGPIVAVCVVTVLPVLWVAIDQMPERASRHRPEGGGDGGQRDARSVAHDPARHHDSRVAAAIARTRELINSGELPPTPSANAVHKALGGAMDTARAVRDFLRRDT